jgi:predicted acylesterase/phospholipase RssA/CRP-like cAMP-binding protein
MVSRMSGPQQRHELNAFLLGIPLFASLDETTRLELAGQLEPVHVAAGDVVLRQGDPGDGLFLLVSGRLRISVAAGGAERVLYDVGRGAIIGEIALLSDRPRTATVRAVRDSDLLLLRVFSFRSLTKRNPALLTEMTGLLVDRLLTVDQLLTGGRRQASAPAARTITVAAAGNSTGASGTGITGTGAKRNSTAEMVARQLAAELARVGSVFRVDAEVVARHLGQDAAQRGPGDAGRAELTGWLDRIERGHDRVIYSPDAQDTPWSRLCLSQSDVVLLAASARDDPSVGPVEARALATASLRCELALMHEAAPSGTAGWLKSRAVTDYHHLRAGRPGDVARLARMITGTGYGLVLGGGGARGLAHLGVIRALEEAGVPIDVVGGTSIGAIMAALCALGLDHAERVRRVGGIARNGRRLFTPTLPLIALSSGRRVDRVLAEHLGSSLMEDLPLRFFCVSANLTRAEAVIHERGPLWPAVRASLSLPGIFPPVYAGGDLLIDGTALDNMPVETMRSRIGVGRIVAVDVSPKVEPMAAATPFDVGLSGWRVLGRRLNPLAPPQQVPGVVDIVARSTGLSQIRERRSTIDGDDIDLLLRPPVGGISTLNFKGAIALIEVGYQHAAEALAKSGLAKSELT